jgi:protein SCO1/2
VAERPTRGTRPTRSLARPLVAALAGVLACLLLAACGGSAADGGVVSGVSSSDHDGMAGAVLSSPYPWGEEHLVDSEGQELDTRSSLKAPLTLVFFGYTKCPDICQAVMADITSAVNRLDPADADKVDVWFVTTDPARDTPQTLRAYLDRFSPSFEGVTGPLADIVDLARPVHVAIEKGQKLPSGGYEVTHGTAVMGVLRDGSVPILWTQGTSPAGMAEDIHTILTSGIPNEDHAS